MKFLSVSRLYWMLGIGWPSVIFLTLIIVLSSFANGWVLWFYMIILALFFVLVIYRVYRWNGSPWRRIHFRGMLVFSSLAGKESAESRIENREYDIKIPIYRMLHIMSYKHGKELAEEIYDDIEVNGSDIYYHILDKHIRGLRPDLSDFDIIMLLHEASKSAISPYLALACLIEKKYGSMEAAKYVLALINKEAT